MTMQSAISEYERHFTDPVDVPQDELLAFVDWALDFTSKGRVSIVYRPAMDLMQEGDLFP